MNGYVIGYAPSNLTQAVEAREGHVQGVDRLNGNTDVKQGVVANSRRWWRNSGMLLSAVLTLKWMDKLAVPRLS